MRRKRRLEERKQRGRREAAGIHGTLERDAGQ